MDSNNQDNSYDNGFNSQDGQDNNPYNDPNYSNPSFPKDRTVVSGSEHFEQSAESTSSNEQSTYGQNSEAYSRDNNEAHSQDPYGQNNGAYSQDPYGQNNGAYSQDPYGQNNGAYSQDPYGQNNGAYTQKPNGQTNGQYPKNTGSQNNAQNNPAQGLEIASLVMGILSLICCGTFIFSIIGIVLVAIAKSKTDKLSGVGIGGLVCCIVSLVFGIIAILLAVLGSGFIPEFFEAFDSGYGL